MKLSNLRPAKKSVRTALLCYTNTNDYIYIYKPKQYWTTNNFTLSNSCNFEKKKIHNHKTLFIYDPRDKRNISRLIETSSSKNDNNYIGIYYIISSSKLYSLTSAGYIKLDKYIIDYCSSLFFANWRYFFNSVESEFGIWRT